MGVARKAGFSSTSEFRLVWREGLLVKLNSLNLVLGLIRPPARSELVVNWRYAALPSWLSQVVETYRRIWVRPAS